MKIKLGNKETIHFVGIGGIGMSGLAIIMKELGFKVQGSDISTNKNIDRVKQKNCLLYTSDAADEEDSVDLGGRRIIKKK